MLIRKHTLDENHLGREDSVGFLKVTIELRYDKK